MSPPTPPPSLWSPPASAPAGKYHIVKPLKIGGTAAIYLAVMRGENNFSREVVIKRPLPHLVAEPRSRHMFIDEAHIASRLSHPNICQVLDLVARDDELYIVLEYLRGVDLREILKRCIQLGRMVPPEIAVYIAVEMAAGLGYAHDATAHDGRPLHLVHRDVSPKNVRITFEGSVKVIDFGIARAEMRITQTSAGTIKGTLGYMSPEQILGDDIDRRSDIFAFGIVLFQMLTLRNPFDGPTLKDRVRKLTQAPIPSVREFNPALDDDIADIVRTCLARDVDGRYPRLDDVQAALDQYMARLQVVSPRQRLIGFLREIFPSLDDLDEDLKSAIEEISRLSGPVDASVRLRFPDDPPTEPMIPPGGPSGPTFPSTAATHPTTAAETERAASTTKPIPGNRPAEETAGADPTLMPAHLGADAGRGDTRPLPELAPTPSPPPSRTIGLMIALAVVVMVSTVGLTIALWPSTNVFVEPLPVPQAPPATAALDEGPAPPQAPRAVPVARRPKRAAPAAKARRARVDKDRARLLFQTGARLKKVGQVDDARWLYELAYAYSGKEPNAAIFLNLGLLYNEQGREAQAKACLQGYLQRQPSSPQAARVRMLLSSYPPLKTVPCVDRSAVNRARRAESRRGAQVEAWLNETLEQRLR